VLVAGRRESELCRRAWTLDRRAMVGAGALVRVMVQAPQHRGSERRRLS